MKIPNLVDLTCQAVSELITEYMHGTLSAAEQVRFEQHLHACTWCMTYLAQMRRTVELTARVSEPESESESDSTVDHAQLLELYRTWQRKKT
jgi:anti-sigma factor RsiW